MTTSTHRPHRPPRASRPAHAPLLLLAIAALALLAGCTGRASATEVRANGNAINSGRPAAPAGSRASAALVPPPVGAPPTQPVPVPAPAISARSAIVVDDATGAVLYDLNGRVRIPPASLTKIASAALAIERGRLDDTVTIETDFTDPALFDASVMGLHRGDRFTLRDLLYGMMLPSGADASVAVARAVSGSEQAFVKEMNALMESLGLFDTNFVDPHGLGGPTHLSTAYDMAMLSRYAMRQSLFARIAGTRLYRAAGTRTIELYNTNPWAFDYPGGDGVKSGFTEEAGPTLAASATRDGHRVIVVVLDSTRRNTDTTALMDWAFRTFCWNDGALGCKPGR